jgi:hypothetical protein
VMNEPDSRAEDLAQNADPDEFGGPHGNSNPDGDAG